MEAKHTWHAMDGPAVKAALQTDAQKGLTAGAARKRLQAYGPNRLHEERPPSLWHFFFKQFGDFMVLVLLGAAGISLLLGEKHDAAAILVIIILNALLGFLQEFRAERSLQALRKLTAARTRVLRDGRVRDVPAEEVVPGDLILIESGDRVPADARLIEGAALEVDEAPLTGESSPARKDAGWKGTGTEGVGDRVNMVFMGTAATRGRGRALVVATGMLTEIGEIAGMMTGTRPGPTPLQLRLEQLGRWLVAACTLIVALVFAVGILQGLPFYQMFLIGVSLAVAAIPEGLPAVVTISLALGVQRMIRRQAIIRRLPAVETLGCATVICSDKTGTLTRNEMTVTHLWLAERGLQVTGTGYEPRGQFTWEGRPVPVPQDTDLQQALEICARCNHAQVERAEGNQQGLRRGRAQSAWSLVGDPTEGALLVAALKGGSDPDQLAAGRPVVAEIPFDAVRRRMTVVIRAGNRGRALVKGAPDLILARCTKVLRAGRVQTLSNAERRRISAAVDDLGNQALRVLALAYKDVPLPVSGAGTTPSDTDTQAESWENNLVFVGLAGLMDPPRPEARQAIVKARRAGIRTIMVTGDHGRTAAAVARSLDLLHGTQRVVTGEAIDNMNDGTLQDMVMQTNVFARVSPRHKRRIVRALQARHQVVAMTGDGVNDAPAVKEADIGIAMGRTGTDVTREASAMVLADDNYATIVAAVEEGRGIYTNIRKFIRYLLGCNAGEVLTMFLAVLLGMPLPLLPMQILWMNLVTDGLPAIALGVDPPAAGTMDRPPRSPKEGIFARGLHLRIIYRGVLIGLCALAAFVAALYVWGLDEPHARTVAFTTLVMAQLLYVFQCRSDVDARFRIEFFTNPLLCVAVGASLVMQLAVLYVPTLKTVFGTVGLGPAEWLLILVFAGWSVVVDGILRLVRRQLYRRWSAVRV